MNSKAPVALAMGAGYILGRSHKFRWAVLLGAAAATGQLNGITAKALGRGVEMMRSTPELAGLADSAGRLFESARGAAVSSLTSRAGSMTDSLNDKTDQIGAGGREAVERVGRRGGRRDETEGRPDQDDERRDGRRYDDEAEYDEDEPEDEYDDEQEEDEDEDRDERDEADDLPEPAKQSGRGNGRQRRGSVASRTGR
jgi:hypothetical protein